MTDTTTTPTPTPTPTQLDTVQAIYAAFGRGDLPGLLELLDPDVDWSADVPAPGAELVPMLHRGRGRDAARAYFAGVGQLEFHAFDVQAFHADGDVVLAEVHFEATHRTTGTRLSMDEIHRWVVRDGRAVQYRPYLDTATLIEAYRP